MDCRDLSLSLARLVKQKRHENHTCGFLRYIKKIATMSSSLRWVGGWVGEKIVIFGGIKFRLRDSGSVEWTNLLNDAAIKNSPSTSVNYWDWIMVWKCWDEIEIDGGGWEEEIFRKFKNFKTCWNFTLNLPFKPPHIFDITLSHCQHKRQTMKSRNWLFQSPRLPLIDRICDQKKNKFLCTN